MGELDAQDKDIGGYAGLSQSKENKKYPREAGISTEVPKVSGDKVPKMKTQKVHMPRMGGRK